MVAVRSTSLRQGYGWQASEGYGWQASEGYGWQASEGCPPKLQKSEGGLLKYNNTTIQQYNNTTIQRYNQVQHKMFFVYHLQSVEHPEEKYTGYTTDTSKRLESHNNAQVPHTANHKPWKLINYFAFDTVDKARKFEHYLKSGSGRAFAQKHF